jgi:hypothetical protein
MSSILKALKKLENDTRKSRPDRLGIDAKIVLDGASTGFSRTAVSLMAVVLFVCGGGATYFYLKHDAPNVIAPQTIASRADSNRQSPVSANIPAVLKSRSKSESVQITTPSLLPSKSPPVLGTQAHSHNEPLKSSQPPRPEEQLGIADSKPKVLTMPAAPTSAVIRPTLTINGIAFQEGGSDNLAVINGITVSNGDVIEGIKVEEIHKDRVRFSHGSEKFEIILNRSNR